MTKYRYHVLTGDVQRRFRDFIKQICDAEAVRILKGVVSKGHVHLHIEYAPSKSNSDLLKRLKGCTSRRLQEEILSWARNFIPVALNLWTSSP